MPRKKNHTKRNRRLLIAALLAWVVGLVVWYVHDKNFQVLNPKGTIAVKEHNLLLITVLLSAIVVIPVFTLLFYISWKYRESNATASYKPEEDGNRALELLWWGIPGAIILALSIITWNSSHALDPRRPLVSHAKPLSVQVIALDWKWLFIYPEQGVASLNYLKIPVGRPVNFQITSDAPMNSFWIPQLGGQIYAMPGMSTRLHLQADQAGEYDGSSANLSGAGFAGMRFTASAGPQEDFDEWVRMAHTSDATLTKYTYADLSKPSTNNPVTTYSMIDPNLYSRVVNKYMTPEAD